MLASSAWDGGYLAKLMPIGFEWTGYVLNLTVDFTGMVLIYWYGRLRQCPKNTNKYKMASLLLPGEFIALGYSWFFSWLNLRRIMPMVVGENAAWVAMVTAAYVPLQLLFIGTTQAILEGRSDQFEVDQRRTESTAKRKEAKLRKTKEVEFAATNYDNRKVPPRATRYVMARDGWKCYHCGADMQDWDRGEIHVDHFYPTSLGGSDDPMNLVISCKKCNLSKNAKPPTESEVRGFQVHLIKKSEYPNQEKVWLLNHMGLLTQQKSIATELGISRSYVSTSLKKLSGKQNGHLALFCEQLSQVGKPGVNQEQATTAAEQLA
jgi:hypothetical protein